MAQVSSVTYLHLSHPTLQQIQSLIFLHKASDTVVIKYGNKKGWCLPGDNSVLTLPDRPDPAQPSMCGGGGGGQQLSCFVVSVVGSNPKLKTEK